MKTLEKTLILVNPITRIKKIALLTFVLCAISFNANAQFTATGSSSNSSSNYEGCNQLLKYKRGVVYSLAPGIIQKRATSKTITVKVKKTSGRAETQVNIYVNGQFKKKIEFDNGNYTTDYKTRVLNNVKGKMIKIEIVNQSVGNTFGYTARIKGKRKNLNEDGHSLKGTLFGPMQKVMITKSSCTNKIKLSIRFENRSTLRAKATVTVFRKSGNRWSRVSSHVIEKSQRNWSKTFNNNKKYKVVLKNISVAESLKYDMKAVAIQ